MKFHNPTTCRCAACGAEAQLPVSQLLALTADCPTCGASLSDIGLRMRDGAYEWATFFNAMRIILEAKHQLSITIPDESIEEVCARKELTLSDLITLVTRASHSVSPTLAEEAIRSAVRTKFPGAPESPDFTAPLLDATSTRPQFGEFKMKPDFRQM
jgi:hypothetical protein